MVFINRTLNLKRINYIGFDMDHTLVRYNSRNFEELAHKIMLEKLVADRAYPAAVLNLPFDFDRAIRGLVIDKQRGNILKLSRYAAIRVSHHGMKPIDYLTQKKLYKSVYVDLRESNYDTVDTSFSIAFASLFAQLVDFKDSHPGAALPDYATIASDLNLVLDRAHRDGGLKDEVSRNLQKFVLTNEVMVRNLEKYRAHDKQLFLLTNSEYHYAKTLLDYVINPYLTRYKSWRELFNFIIFAAQKPRFFFDNLKFLRVDPANGTMTNFEGKLEPGVYQGGCANVFTSELGLRGDEILYVGDHIYGDILRLKKDCNWRTALVVEELQDEIEKNGTAEPYRMEIEKYMNQKLPLERQLDDAVSAKIESGRTNLEAEIARLQKLIQELDQKISPLIKKQQSVYNPYWGEVFRVGIEESYFAYQVERFACIYMSKLNDLLEMSPRTYFRSSRRLMAHELGQGIRTTMIAP